MPILHLHIQEPVPDPHSAKHFNSVEYQGLDIFASSTEAETEAAETLQEVTESHHTVDDDANTSSEQQWRRSGSDGEEAARIVIHSDNSAEVSDAD